MFVCVRACFSLCDILYMYSFEPLERIIWWKFSRITPIVIGPLYLTYFLSPLDKRIPVRAHQVWSGVHRLRQLGETPPVFSIEGGPWIWDEHSPEGKPSTQRDIRFR